MASKHLDEYGVLLFDSTQRALKAEKMLKSAGFVVKLIPVPRQIASDCGVCLRFLWKDLDKLERLLGEETLLHAGVRRLS